MLEERRTMFQHFVQAAIQIILLRQAKILLQQIGHRAVLKPLPMQPPFTARINQPINRQRLQHMTPASSLPRIGQTLPPELIQLQLIPQPIPHPTRAPLPQTPQLTLIQPNLDAILGRVGSKTPSRSAEQGQLAGLPPHRIKHPGHLGPSRLLAVVDLAQIEQMPLHPTLARAHLLPNAPIAMILAVFESVMTVQIRLGHNNDPHLTVISQSRGRGQVCTKRSFAAKPLKSLGNSGSPPAKSLKTTPSCESRVKAISRFAGFARRSHSHHQKNEVNSQ